QPHHGGDVVEVGHVVEPQRVGREQAGTEDGQRRILGAGHHDFALQRQAAGNLEFIHAEIWERPAACQPPWAAYSSGVRVRIDNAWISARIRSPSAAYTN